MEKEEEVLKLPAKLEHMEVALAFVSSVIDSHGCSPQARTQIRIAVEELYVNIAHYAYPAGKGYAEIRASIDDDVLTLKLIDEGEPFDPLAKPDPDITLSGEEREIGGLGIYMVKATMDDVSYAYRDGHNELTIRKRL